MAGLKALGGSLVCYWPQVEMRRPITVLPCTRPLRTMLILFLKVSFISRLREFPFPTPWTYCGHEVQTLPPDPKSKPYSEPFRNVMKHPQGDSVSTLEFLNPYCHRMSKKKVHVIPFSIVFKALKIQHSYPARKVILGLSKGEKRSCAGV